MADLIDRIRGKNDLGRPKLAVPQFFGVLVLVAGGDMTEAEAKQDADLQGAELTQANAVLAVLNGKSNLAAKIAYALKTFSVGVLLERGFPDDTIYNNSDGTINKTRVKLDMEI